MSLNDAIDFVNSHALSAQIRAMYSTGPPTSKGADDDEEEYSEGE